MDAREYFAGPAYRKGDPAELPGWCTVGKAIEIYEARPIFYGLGCFSFHTGHEGRVQGDWVGLMVRVVLEDRKIMKVTGLPVRHNEKNGTIIRTAREEQKAMQRLVELSNKFNTKLDIAGEEVVVWQAG